MSRSVTLEVTVSDPKQNALLAQIQTAIPTDQVQRQVEKICRSKAFAGKDNPKRLLPYLVNQTLAGTVPTPQAIATEVLGKLDFGPGDSNVRTEMRRLRGALAEYYEEESTPDDIYLHVPERQYTVGWRHSPKSLLGQSETTGWILRSARLSPEEEQKSLETANHFWPHLASVYPVFCDQDFHATLLNGHIELPQPVTLFFNSIGNHHLFITSPDCSEIRLYPINVWLSEWARKKRSENVSDHMSLGALELWGNAAQIDNSASVSIHAKLLKKLNVPDGPFEISLTFHPEGVLHFYLPKPDPRPTGRCKLYSLSYRSPNGGEYYYCVLVDLERDEAFQTALQGKDPLNLKSYAYIAASGEGKPPEDLLDKLRAKYDVVLVENEPPPSTESPPSGS